MIFIDFIAGSHGNFLEFACNTLLANIDSNELPFNSLGSAHNKKYSSSKVFSANHYFQFELKLTNRRVISIRITHNDLLPLSSISLLRAGEYNYDNNTLEVNTFNKLNNKNYQWVLANIIDKYSLNNIQNSYNAVKDSLWPQVTCLNDFKKLPQWIKDECLQVHNLHLVEISEEYPDCPRWILREFFKLSFKYPEQAGFITEQSKMVYDSSNDVYEFSFDSFYDLEKFKKELQAISTWAGLPYQDPTYLHSEFMKRQPYYNAKSICDDILDQIYAGKSFDLPAVDLMKESYLTAKLELYYNREFPVYQPNWFTNSQEIFNFIESKAC